jgi:hypothetical protein
MDPEEKFNNLLSRLKNDEPVYAGEPGHISAVIRPAPTPQLRAWAIKIMESPMFYRGGLRGKKLPVSGKPRDKVLPVSDLESLVMLLAADLEKHQAGKLGVMDLRFHFDKVLADFEEVIPYVYAASDYKVKERIVVVRRKLQELRGKIPAHFRNPQLMDQVGWRIKAFVPGVKIAETTRATELLLSHLGIPVKRETARRRSYRARDKDEVKDGNL